MHIQMHGRDKYKIVEGASKPEALYTFNFIVIIFVFIFAFKTVKLSCCCCGDGNGHGNRSKTARFVPSPTNLLQIEIL